MKRSKHSLSHYRLTSLNMGQIFPVGMQEVLPGDSFRHQCAALVRCAPLVAPVMHPVDVMLHTWYVPARLLWTNWELFITGSNPALLLPTMAIGTADTALKRLAQALGIGAEIPSGSVTVQTLPFRAYNKIYNQFYRDQDLTTAIPERITDSGDLAADYLIRNASWEKDYFTTARPFPQQGANTEVVPITFNQPNVPVKGIGTQGAAGIAAAVNQTVRETGSVGSTNYPFAASTSGAGNYMVKLTANPGIPDVTADLSGVSAGTMDINALRRSMAMQRMKEHRSRYGSRYVDMLRYLGINPSDGRLDRPEYMGGAKQTISFSEVLSTADVGTADVGTMAGHGIAALRSRPYTRFFEEHGYVLTFMVIRPKTIYQNQIPRTFLRRAYSDFWQKELEVQGEQGITNAEIYGDAGAPAGIFGYIPRYDEYRHAESFVTGEFRTTLNYWHMGRIFASQPVLNAAFVASDPTTRIYAASATDQIYAMVSHRISARRLVSKFARTG